VCPIAVGCGTHRASDFSGRTGRLGLYETHLPFGEYLVETALTQQQVDILVRALEMEYPDVSPGSSPTVSTVHGK
jgi:hypothetical protein